MGFAMLNPSYLADSRSIQEYLIGHCKKPLAASEAWREAKQSMLLKKLIKLDCFVTLFLAMTPIIVQVLI